MKTSAQAIPITTSRTFVRIVRPPVESKRDLVRVDADNMGQASLAERFAARAANDHVISEAQQMKRQELLRGDVLTAFLISLFDHEPVTSSPGGWQEV